MLTGLYFSAAGMQAQEMRQAVLANNLANAQTTGFKRDLLQIQTRAAAVDEDPSMAQYRVPIVDKEGGGVLPTGAGIDLTQASLLKTGNQTDLSLEGKGFFQVQGDKPGQKLLTRDGRFLVNAEGTLVTATSGRPVLSSSGDPIKLNPSATLPIAIDQQGNISQADGTSAKLGLIDITDAAQLQKIGGNLLTTNAKNQKEIAPDTVVRQGSLEESGVDPIVEMVNMLEGQRAFEANAKMITFQDQSLSELNTIGKVA